MPPEYTLGGMEQSGRLPEAPPSKRGLGGRSVQAGPEGGPVVAKKGVKRNGGYRVWTGLHGEGRGKEKLLSLHYK